MKNQMTLTELTAAIQEYGDFKIEKLNPGYKVSIYLGRTECPVVIMSDLEGEDFLKYFKEEMRSRKLQRVKHYKAFKYEQARADRQNGRDYYRSCSR